MSPESAYLVSFALIICMKIICFILGYFTIRLGYQLISSGVKGEFKFTTSFGGFKADLASISPGLLFVLLGVLLIGYAMHVEKSVTMEKGTRTHQNLPDVPIPEGSPFEDMKEDMEDDIN